MKVGKFGIAFLAGFIPVQVFASVSESHKAPQATKGKQTTLDTASGSGVREDINAKPTPRPSDSNKSGGGGGPNGGGKGDK